MEAAIAELPVSLKPAVRMVDLTVEEQSDWRKLDEWADEQQASDEDRAKVAYLLFVNQRRSTRSWSVGCAVTAGAFGLLMGYLAWGRK